MKEFYKIPKQRFIAIFRQYAITNQKFGNKPEKKASFFYRAARELQTTVSSNYKVILAKAKAMAFWDQVLP